MKKDASQKKYCSVFLNLSKEESILLRRILSAKGVTANSYIKNNCIQKKWKEFIGG